MLWRLIYFDPNRKIGAVSPYPKQLLVEAIINGEEIGAACLE